MYSLDKPRDGGLVIEREPQPPHGRIQAMLEIDICPTWPEAPAELLTADHLTRTLQKGRQYAQRLLLQPDAKSLLAELAGAEVDFKGAEPMQ